MASPSDLSTREGRQVRAKLIAELAYLDPQPESVPISMLVKVPGTLMAIEADQRLFAKLGLKPEPVQGQRCAGHD